MESVGIKIYLLLFHEKQNIIENTVNSYKLQAGFFFFSSPFVQITKYYFLPPSIVYLWLIEEPTFQRKT